MYTWLGGAAGAGAGAGGGATTTTVGAGAVLVTVTTGAAGGGITAVADGGGGGVDLERAAGMGATVAIGFGWSPGSDDVSMAIQPTAASPATARAAANPLTIQPDADDLGTVGWTTVGSAGATKYVGASVVCEGLVGSDGAAKCVVVGAFMSNS